MTINFSDPLINFSDPDTPFDGEFPVVPIRGGADEKPRRKGKKRTEYHYKGIGGALNWESAAITSLVHKELATFVVPPPIIVAPKPQPDWQKLTAFLSWLKPKRIPLRASYLGRGELPIFTGQSSSAFVDPNREARDEEWLLWESLGLEELVEL